MKLRFTALSISSIDMNTVIILRRNRKPATPSANKIALRIKYQEKGTPTTKGIGILFDLLPGQNDGAHDGDQNQHARNFEWKQVGGKQTRSDGFRGPERITSE